MIWKCLVSVQLASFRCLCKASSHKQSQNPLSLSQAYCTIGSPFFGLVSTRTARFVFMPHQRSKVPQLLLFLVQLLSLERSSGNGWCFTVDVFVCTAARQVPLLDQLTLAGTLCVVEYKCLQVLDLSGLNGDNLTDRHM
jgi:hypothetical protein